jgi:hypothetical protein
MDLSILRDTLRQATPDITIKGVDWASDQFPDDDYDPTAVGQVTVTFRVQGQTLARLLGKQERVLSEAIGKLNGRSAIGLLRSGPVPDQILKVLTPAVQKLVAQTAGDRFERSVRGTKVDYSDQTTYWSADVDQATQSITYEVDFDVLWTWV